MCHISRCVEIGLDADLQKQVCNPNPNPMHLLYTLRQPKSKDESKTLLINQKAGEVETEPKSTTNQRENMCNKGLAIKRGADP